MGMAMWVGHVLSYYGRGRDDELFGEVCIRGRQASQPRTIPTSSHGTAFFKPRPPHRSTFLFSTRPILERAPMTSNLVQVL